MTSKPPKIIYICGSGRSGSTVLDIILSNQEDSFGVGELNYLHRFINSKSEFCACGSLYESCSFWPDVLKEWKKRTKNENALEDLQAKQNMFERFKTLPLGFWHFIKKSPDYLSYLKLNEDLYASIAHIAKKDTLIDSSKNPLRAFYLSSSKNLDINTIHLIRDGRGVAYSLSKAYEKDIKKGVQTSLAPKPVWRTALFWCITNLFSHFVSLFKNQNYTRLYYEDFIENAPRVLSKIGKISNLSYTKVIDKLNHDKPFKAGHTVAGNRLRMKGSVKLKSSDDWRESFPKSKRLVFSIIAFPFLIFYGYFR